MIGATALLFAMVLMAGGTGGCSLFGRKGPARTGGSPPAGDERLPEGWTEESGVLQAPALQTADIEVQNPRIGEILSQLGAVEDARGVVIRLPDVVLFDFDSDQLRPEGKAVLDRVAESIRYYQKPVRIEGHTDSVGSEEYNQGLSERRANAVRDYLVQNGKIPATLLTAQGFGETRPVASNETAAGRQENRRVEIIIETGGVSGQAPQAEGS